MAKRTGKPDQAPALKPQAGPLIAATKLNALLKDVNAHAKRVSKSVGDLREAIGFAVEKHHLDKQAFATIRKFDKMEPEELAAYWANLRAYMGMTGIDAKIESVTTMDFGENKNVVPIKQAAE